MTAAMIPSEILKKVHLIELSLSGIAVLSRSDEGDVHDRLPGESVPYSPWFG